LGPHLRLGLLLSGQHPAGDSAVGPVGQHLEQVELARELGFSSVWTSQHFLSHPFVYWQSVPLLARVAAAAEGMTVADRDSVVDSAQPGRGGRERGRRAGLSSVC
jgi:alkanesulfonate monooxygenase SsuD/methylene tetrahydromethanopterin reductase-like flavin-dependent oxidoreductase (luciferase family)